MKTFRVKLRRMVVEYASVIVLADDAIEAEHMAKGVGLENDAWWAEDESDPPSRTVEAIDVEDVEG